MIQHQRRLQVILPLLLLLYIGALFYLATSTSLPSMPNIEDFDKIVHFIEFFILMALVLFTFAVYEFEDHKILAIATTLLIVVISELVQVPILSRTFSVLDIMADLTGAFLAFIILYGVDLKWNFLKQFC